MGKASARKKMARRAPRARVQRKLFTAWNMTVSSVVVLGVLLVALSRNNDSLYGTPAGAVGPAISDHWHAAYGVNLCGVWQPPVPEWESVAGLHTHGDGLMHIHPFTSRGEFENATVEHLLVPSSATNSTRARSSPRATTSCCRGRRATSRSPRPRS
jgi:hypothetical protein